MEHRIANACRNSRHAAGSSLQLASWNSLQESSWGPVDNDRVTTLYRLNMEFGLLVHSCACNLCPAMGARNQVGIGLSYRPASLCSLATQFQTRFLKSIPRLIVGLKIQTLYSLARLVSQDRRHLFVTPCTSGSTPLATFSKQFFFSFYISSFSPIFLSPFFKNNSPKRVIIPSAEIKSYTPPPPSTPVSYF
jgi:hypothetical protein